MKELYSFYTDDKNESITVFQKSEELIKENENMPLLVEREKVLLEDLLSTKQIFYRQKFKESNLIKILEKQGCFKDTFSRTKHADIHLSIPLEYIEPQFDRMLQDCNMTFIKIIRQENENIPGGCKSEQQWIAYTIQFVGQNSVYNSKIIYELFKKTFMECNGFQQGILKLEQVTDIYISQNHRGIPAVEAEHKIDFLKKEGKINLQDSFA